MTVPFLGGVTNNTEVLFMDKNKIVRFWVDKGCPQGFCLGPLFWTLVANLILKSLSPPRKYIAFAGVFLPLESAKSSRELEASVNEALEEFVQVSYSKVLEVSTEKSEVILFGKARKLVRKPVFKIIPERLR